MYITVQKSNVFVITITILFFVFFIFGTIQNDEKSPPVSRLGHLWSKHLPPYNTKAEFCPAPKSEGGKYVEKVFREKFDDFYLPCDNIQRIGGQGLVNGGKFLCLDAIVPNDCIVYSLGSNYDFKFEIEIISRFHCQVYTFDCTHTEVDEEKIPKGVHFYPWCVGASNERRRYRDEDYKLDLEEVQFYNLSTIVRKLGHHRIDVLKIDIERHEFQVIPSMQKDVVPRQIAFEAHLKNHHGLWGRPVLESEWRAVWNKLYELGYGVFSYEPNVDWHCCCEYSLLLR